MQQHSPALVRRTPMRILFVDDEPGHVDVVQRTVAEALDAEVVVADSVEAAVRSLHESTFDLVVTDIFIPLGSKPRDTMGPRSRRYEETVQHLGGLVLLDELDRVDPRPKVLAHTACTDMALIEILGDCVSGRVPKPAPVDVLLRAVLEALDLPTPQ
jgi:DNA-binding NarL/FixJ family response regulator